MSLHEDNQTDAFNQKLKEQGIISVQSMVVKAEEYESYDFSHHWPQNNAISDEERAIDHLSRQTSCLSVESFCENSGEDDELERNDLERKNSCDSDRSTSVVSDGSEEGARDSGVEIERDLEVKPITVPDYELMEKLTCQVEFYFSDENVRKDKFLLKHIRRNKEGYVSLKLVSSFKKVKQLTKDWRVVAYALEKISNQIEINDQKTKIRRVDPLPEIDDSPVTCAVLALEIPIEKPSVENVSKIFNSVGDIAFIRVLKSGGSLPPDVKSLLTKYPMLGTKHCAWIEFEIPESAKEATLLSKEGGMKVVLIVPESQKKQERIKQKKQQLNSRKQSNGNRPYNINNNRYQNNFGYNYNRNQGNLYYNAPKNYKFRNGSETENEYNRPSATRRKAVSLPSSQNPFMLDMNNRNKISRPKSKSCTDAPGQSSSSHFWVQRHLFTAAKESAESAATATLSPRMRLNRISAGSLPLPASVIRHPKGPDGTNGFALRRQLKC